MILLNQDLTPFPPSVDEGGTRVVEVYLTSEPSGQMTVAVTTDPADVSDYATVSPSSLTFGTGDGWDGPQTITITGVEENSDQEDNFFGILLDASDGGYDDVDGDFAVRVVDNDIVGIKLSTDAVTVLEGTTTIDADSDTDATWTVQLNTPPDAGEEVVVSITSSNSDSATALPSEFTFTTGGDGDTVMWDAPKTVTVTGETDDDISHNVVIFKHAVTSGTYAAAAATVTVTATDTAEPSIMLGNVVPATDEDSTATLSIDEGTTRYKYTVGLSHRPNGTVEILMPNPDAAKLKLRTDRLVFKRDRGDWDRARNIYVDALPDGNTINDTYIITHTASGGGYDEQEVVLTLTVEDSGKAGLRLSTTNLTLDEDEQGSVSVSLKTQPSAEVVVAVSVTTGADAVTLNEPNAPATLTFTNGNWNKPQTVKVTANDDATIDDESAIVSLNVTSDDTDYTHRAAGEDDPNVIDRTVNVSVTDTDKAGFSLNRSSTNLSEDAGDNVAAVFTIVLDAQPQGTVNVAITSSDTDRVANPSGPSFQTNGWNTAQGVALSLTPDDDNVDNTVTLMMTTTANEPGDALFNGLKASFTVNISDGDRAGIRLSTDAVTVAEGATGTWTVQLNTDPGANNAVKVTITSSNSDSATVDPAEITFTTNGDGATDDWDEAKTVTVTGETDDDISENVVIFTHEVTSGTYAAPSRTVTVTATDTAEPALMLGQVTQGSPNTLSLREGTDRYQYTVGLSHRPNGTVEVMLPNPDPARLTLSTDRLVFKRDRGDWDRARNIYVTVADDNVMNDANVPITITHSASGGGYDNLTAVLAVSIIDDDVPGLKLTTTNATVTEGQTVTWDVTLNTEPVGGDVTVTVGAAGTNVDAISVTGGPLTFDADDWNKPQTVTVMAREDADLVGASAEVTHVARGADYDSISFTVPVTVNDDDSASLVLEGLTNGGLTVNETDSGVTKSFMVKLSAEPLSEVTVTVTKSGSDMVEIASGSESFTIQPSAYGTAREVTINVAADDDSNNESATITLTASGAEFAGKTASVAVSVIDDEVPGISVSETEVSVSEDGSTGTFTVVLNTAPSGDVTVTISNPDTGAVGVSLPSDATSLTFTTTSWETLQTVTVSAVDDDDVGDESVTLTVSASGANYGSVASKTVKVTVTDDDDGTLQFAPATSDGVTVTENSSATYTVRLSHGPNANVTVSLASDMPAVATVSPAKLTFKTSNWQQTQTVTVYGTDDMDAENGSTHIKNTATGGGYEIADGPDTRMAVNVTDDDQPEIIVSTDKLTVNEGGDASFRVRLKTMPSDGNVAVSVTSDNSTSLTIKSGASLTFTSDNYGTAQTVTVTGVEESTGTENVVDEEVTLTIESSGADYQDTTDKMVTVSVDDNDTLTYSFAQDEYSGDEGGPAVTVLLNLNIEPGEVKVFTLQVLHGGGASRADYDVENHPLDPESKFQFTFAANEAIKAISVRIIASDGLDPGESISFVVINSAGVKVGSPSATEVRFTDTEPPPADN